MCDELAAFIERCERLIREGRFDELDTVLREHEPHMAGCLACRRQGSFYRAVVLGMRQPRDYASSRALLAALIESDQVDPVLRARATNFSAMVAEFQDCYGEALRLHQRAWDMCAAAGDLNGQARALFNQAIVVNNRLHDPEQALTLLAQAEKLLEQAENPTEMVRVLNERGLCLMYLERWTEAREALDASYTLCVEQENAYFEAICATNLGSWERLQGHWAEAETWYAPLPARFEQFGNPLLQAEVLFYLSEVVRAQEQLDRTHAYLDQMLQLAKTSASPHFVALAYLGLARLAVQQEEHQQALNLYRQAAHEVEQIRSAQSERYVRLDFQAQWNDLYREATAHALQLGHVEEGWLFSEHARARLLLDTLGVPPDVTRPDAPPHLLNQFEQLETDLHQLYGQQVAGQLDETGQSHLQDQEIRIADIRAILHRYDQETLPYQSPPELCQIQDVLSRDAIVLSYFATGDDLIAFAIDKDEVCQRTLPVPLPQIQARLSPEGQIRDIVPDQYTGRLSPHLRILPLLHSGLLAPITDWLTDHATVYLVPDAELRHIPFHLLAPGPDQPCPLTEGHRRLVYLPSVSVLTRLPALQITDDLAAIGYNGPDLMLVEAHSQRVAELANGQSLSGAAARHGPVMQALNDRSQIYFAGHNIFRTPAPADCGLLLAENRLLTLLDIQKLRLSGGRVILGACQSSLVAERGGDWLGLTSAFLQAGATQVMGTLWPVSEVAMCLLMDRFWAALAKNGTAPWVALQQAQTAIRALTVDDIRQAFKVYDLAPQAQDHVEDQLKALQSALPGTTHPLDHPCYWAPFVLIGV